MTKANIFKTDDTINKINLSGHAFFAEYGQDIVCSAISMVCYTVANQLFIIQEKNVNVKIDEGFFEISIEEVNHDNQLLLNTLVTGIRMIEEEYENAIKIKEVAYV